MAAVEILTSREQDALRRAGRVAAETLAFVGSQIRAGITTAAIDRWVRAAEASQTGYERFSKLWRVSFHEQQCHADISIEFSKLTEDFEATCADLREAVG